MSDEHADVEADADSSIPPPTKPEPEPNPASAGRRPRWQRALLRALGVLLVVIITWLVLAYAVLPILWRHYEHHPVMENAPKVTRTAQGIPGDPLNVGLIGSESEVIQSMLNSGWDAADPITFRSSLAIAGSVLRDRPDPDAPVSNLFLFGRKQDLAFEKPVGTSARRRHHVRFWESVELGRDGVPLWIGAVTFDESVGLSHRTGQITHHIGPDIDAERDGLIADLRSHGRLAEVFQVTGVGATLSGRNGGGDRYVTDGELTICLLAPAPAPDRSPRTLDNPPAVRIKQQLWSVIRPLVRSLPGPPDQDAS
ncbi:LssY C-terminal domain-containing protein [Tautonia sp. JC769]|uniref:LssY C-terminal domain-containing protein n=1 Tax=Tautonia sp. JC769 TaxID=3232135 RepID=UPI00345AC461